VVFADHQPFPEPGIQLRKFIDNNVIPDIRRLLEIVSFFQQHLQGGDQSQQCFLARVYADIGGFTVRQGIAEAMTVNA